MSTAAPAAAPAPAKLDDLMLAMDVVDTLRHREKLVEKELDDDSREQQLIERLRSLYKSQGIEVPDSIIAEGVKALKESRFVYTPAPPGLARNLAALWVRRGAISKWALIGAAAIVAAFGAYHYSVVAPRERAVEAARTELTQTLPRDIAAARQAIAAEAKAPAARERGEAVVAQGVAALQRGDAAGARAALGELDRLLAALRQEYVLRIPGRPEDQTGFFREHPSFQGRAYFLVVDALDPQGAPVKLAVRNDETNQTDTVSRFAVRVPQQTFDAVRADKARNGVVQNARLGEKKRGYLDPDFNMPVLEGRITRW
ncbi:MAG: hypothetical protein BGP06_11100 [Rhizobiales bacterium 65-9]|nr:hypothetical protein [Hyphomicrobiales bacterium]OJY32875.1 MAG: hypothetical protein BGP06_11100 [Rhizobiales bacterium 65-9]